MEWILPLLVFAVCGGVAFAGVGGRLPRMLLLVSAIAISALLFLPSDWLADLVGRDFVHRLYRWTRSTPWRPPEWIHFFAFLWLGLVLWLARPGQRGWPLVAALAVLAVAAELAQWFTSTRTPRVDDVAVNLLGAAIGVALAAGILGLKRRRRSRVNKRN